MDLSKLTKLLKSFSKKAPVEAIDEITEMETKTITPGQVEKYFKNIADNKEPAQSMVDARDYYEQLARKRQGKLPQDMAQGIKQEEQSRLRAKLKDWEHPLDIARKQEASQMQKEFAESVDEPTRLANYERSLRNKEQEVANREIAEFTKKKQQELMDKYGPDYFKEGTNADIKVISNDEIKAAEEALGKKKKASAIMAGAPAMASEDSENGFVSKLKKAMSDKYEEYGEAAADKYNKFSDWVELLKEKQEQDRQKTMRQFGMDSETRGSTFGMTPEEYDSMIQDIGTSSPAMGVGKALKATPKMLEKLMKK